ncbi:MAG: hypothetical protein ACREQ3_24990, partial [Candidatus Binatia bacterium]
MTRRIGIFLVAACLTVVPTQAWQGQPDNKPAAELERMTEGELAHEALSACFGGASLGTANGSAPSVQKEALRYITTISRYARRQNGGTTPWWVIDMYDATQTGDRAQCQNIWHQVVAQARNEEVGG